MLSFEILVVWRQVMSNTHVVGKQLVNADGFNRFALKLEYPDGHVEGVIYRVQPSLEHDGRLYRDHKDDIDVNDPRLIGAPSYKMAELGNDFWLEEF